MDPNKNNRPDYVCAALSRMLPDMQIVRDVTAGTRAVRAASAAYLPKNAAEPDQSYQKRLAVAALYPATARTWQGLVGMVFRREAEPAEDCPEIIRGVEGTGDAEAVEGHWENIDNAGTHGTVFSQELFAEAVRDGHAAILVDAPPMPGDTPLSIADEQALGLRPYWIRYSADQVISWRHTVENGKTYLQQVVFAEETMEPDGEYGEKAVKRFRVLRRGTLVEELTGTVLPVVSFEVLKLVVIDGKEDFVSEASGVIRNQDEIPVAFLFTRKKGPMESTPPLLALAEQNLRHYRFESRFEKSTEMCLPIPIRVGASEVEKKLIISEDGLIDVPAGGDFKFAEATGTSLAPIQTEIDKIESRMARLGLALLEPTSGPSGQQTATESVLDHVKEESELSSWVRALKDCLERALYFHAKYLGFESGGSMDLQAVIEDMTLPPEMLRILSDMVDRNQLTVETLWSKMASAEVLKDGFDPNKEKAGIEAAKAEAMQQAQELGAQALRAFDRGGNAGPDAAQGA